MPDYYEVLGAVIKKARASAGLTQEQLSIASGVDCRTIINIEMCRGNPTFTSLYHLVKTLHIDAREIFDSSPKATTPAKEHMNYVINDCTDAEAEFLSVVTDTMLSALRDKVEWNI